MVLPLIRPICFEDLDVLEQFSEAAGAGFITLPKDRKLLENRILLSVESFQKEILHPHQECYFFVLELLPEKKVVGVCGILSRIGVSEPFCYYELKKEHFQSQSIHFSNSYDKLEFKKERRNPTEICALYLNPAHRHSDFGYLLSYSRFLFMKQYKKRFTSTVMAEMRGYFDKKGSSPFWEAIGRHFFQMDFEQANSLRISHPHVIEEIFPKESIYPILLPKEAQKVIGQTHPQTMGALKLLKYQGFDFNQHIDLFEAGPHFSAPLENILAIKSAEHYVVKNIVNKIEDQQIAIVANHKPQMRATLAVVKIEGNDAILEGSSSQLLEIGLGDTVCILKNYKGNHV